MNKRLFLTVAAVICFLTLQAQNYSLYDILGGKFSPKGVPATVSSKDGVHYYQSDPAGTAVIKFAYSTGEAVDTLFSTRTARNCNFDTFQGFLVSGDENRVLVYRDREQIYRRSFKANYYYHDVRRNLVRRLSEIGRAHV